MEEDAFDYGDSFGQEDVMGWMLWVFFVYCQVVDGDEEEVAVGAELGSGAVEVDVVAVEGCGGVGGEAGGVVGFEEESLGVGW